MWCVLRFSFQEWGVHYPNYRVLAAEGSKLSFSLRIIIIQRELPCPRLLLLPRDSSHPIPGNVTLQSQNPLCWFRTTQKTHPSSRTPHRISWSLCCNCISIESLSAKFCFLQSFTVLFWQNYLHTNLHLKVYFLENLAQDRGEKVEKKTSEELDIPPFLCVSDKIPYSWPTNFSLGVAEILPVQSEFLIYLYFSTSSVTPLGWKKYSLIF